jgi:hypothetical protein
MQQLKRPSCPLCGSVDSKSYHTDTSRDYLHCPQCQLVFVPPCHWLAPAAEKAIYDLHQNNPQDAGYRRFLSRFTEPLLKVIGCRKQGLDFGCGPGPVLASILQEHGHQVALYDPYYQNSPDKLTGSYDFICATEVVEHLRQPDQEFKRLFALLKPGCWLGIMTKLVLDQQAFSRWHYIRDLTHICFYSHDTFRYLAEKFNAELKFADKDVILLQKKSSEAR